MYKLLIRSIDKGSRTDEKRNVYIATSCYGLSEFAL